MILTLHLTDQCNMNCTYCIHHKKPKDMSLEVLKASCQRIFADKTPAGFSFFGGEPLLKKDLIAYALKYCHEKSKETGISFHSKMTTNGTLLDEEFLLLADQYHLEIGLSFEGLEQDRCRIMANGEPSFDLVSQKAKLLLSHQPLSYAMMTIAPQAVKGFASSVKYLYELGFRRITATIAYGKKVTWSEDDLQTLSDSLDEISTFYQDCIYKKDPFFFSPFDGKIRDYVAGKSTTERCHLGKRQMSVSVDGKIYPCTQFIGDEAYHVGNVFDGLDSEKWIALIQRSMNRPEPSDCMACELRNRCQHTCGCANRLETGDEFSVSPLQCAYEQMIILKSDAIANRVMEKAPELFCQKFVPSKK